MVANTNKRLPLLVIVGALVLAFAGLLVFPFSGTTYAKSPQIVVHQAVTVPHLSTYSSPIWWSNQTCDKGHYSSSYLLTTWRGIQVCGPLPGLNSTGILEAFPSAGASQYEFQCTELIARYLWRVYSLKSQIADGSQIVNAYTSLPGSPFHAVSNDGTSHMVPAEGDVLSYGPSSQNSHGHTSIVIGSSVNTNGNGYINVAEQNIEASGTAKLTMSNWKIQADTNHFGIVSSWMTPRSFPATTVNFTVALSGISNVGSDNNNPLHPVRPVVVQVRNSSNNTIQSINTNIIYSKTTGMYIGVVATNSSLSSGSYNITVKVSNSLNTLAANWFQPGGTFTEPTIKPLAGDVDGNNVLNILDYNDLMSCYGSKYSSCQFQQSADLNDDGSVGGADYNIIIRSFSGIH